MLYKINTKQGIFFFFFLNVEVEAILFQDFITCQPNPHGIGQTRLVMLHAPIDSMATVCIIVLQILFIVNASDVSKPVCRQRQAQPPRVGQRCVSDTEVYISKAGLQHHCVLLCMRDPNCQVINFNLTDSHCLIGERPCLSVENDADVVTISMSATKPCLKWVNKYDKDEHNLISFPSEDGSTKILSVARGMIGNNKIPGKMVSTIGVIRCSWEGREISITEGQSEILTVSSECNISWVPHNPASGLPLPAGIVIGGHLNGNLLYVARKSAVHVVGHPTRYSSGYYDNVDGLGHFPYANLDITHQEVEVLVVQEWNVPQILNDIQSYV